MRQKATTGVVSLKNLFVEVVGFGSTNLLCASLEIVTQRVCEFLVSNANCKSSAIDDLVKRLIKPLMAFSDHLSSLEFN